MTTRAIFQTQTYLRSIDEQYLESFAPKAVILSGGPSSVYEEEAPHLKPELWQVLYDKQIPVLGSISLAFCFSLIANMRVLDTCLCTWSRTRGLVKLDKVLVYEMKLQRI